MAEERQCIMAPIGADEWGRKEIIGLADGYRESTQSWRELLLDLQRHGLTHAPDLAIGDGALAINDFPAGHLKHVRTTNPIESTFATVRHRTGKTKGCLRRKTGLAIAFMLMMSAQTKWRKLDGANLMPEFISEAARDRIKPRQDQNSIDRARVTLRKWLLRELQWADARRAALWQNLLLTP